MTEHADWVEHCVQEFAHKLSQLAQRRSMTRQRNRHVQRHLAFRYRLVANPFGCLVKQDGRGALPRNTFMEESAPSIGVFTPSLELDGHLHLFHEARELAMNPIQLIQRWPPQCTCELV